MDKREGEVSRFLSKITCPTVPKNAVWELFSLSTISGIEQFLDKGEGKYQDFPRNFSVSHCRKFLQGNIYVLCFGKFPLANKFNNEKGGSFKIFCLSFLSQIAERVRRGTL